MRVGYLNWDSDSKAGSNLGGMDEKRAGYGQCMWGRGVLISLSLAALVHGRDTEVGSRWWGVGRVVWVYIWQELVLWTNFITISLYSSDYNVKILSPKARGRICDMQQTASQERHRAGLSANVLDFLLFLCKVVAAELSVSLDLSWESDLREWKMNFS